MTDVALGLVGCGAVAERYYLPILKRHPEACKNLVLVDPNIGQAERLKSQLGEARLAEDFHEILGKVQGVIVCVPHRLHFPIAMEFLGSGCPVLCEKPLAETAREARQMALEAEKNGVALAVNNTRRMFPACRQVKEILASGEMGDLLSIRYVEAMAFGWPSATGFYVNPRNSDKGVLLDIGPHVLDLICWWLEGRPDLISCEDDSFGGPESVVHMKARKGRCSIEVRINRLFDLPSRYKLEGELASLEGDVYGWDRLTLRTRSGKTRKILLKAKEKLYADFVHPIFSNFLDVITKGARPLVPGSEAIPSIEWIETCYENRSRFSLPWYENLEGILD